MDSSVIDENNIVHSSSENAWIATIEDSITSNRLLLSLLGASWNESSKAVYNLFVQLKKVFPDVLFVNVDAQECKRVVVPGNCIVNVGAHFSDGHLHSRGQRSGQDKAYNNTGAASSKDSVLSSASKVINSKMRNTWKKVVQLFFF